MNTSVSRRLYSSCKYMQPKLQNNLQKRWHRSVDKLFHPSIVEQIKIEETAEQNTFEWRMHFLDNHAATSNDIITKENKFVSPWHDIPLGFKDTYLKKLLFHYVNEIPKGGRAKIECATKEMWNPMKQDVKKGALRFFKYGDLPFNYGFIPQTYEDPNHETKYSDVKGLKGDGDPIDVIELSETPLSCGNIVPMKVLSVLGLIDEGESDWKIIGIRADHPKALKINTLDDACEILGKDFKGIILDWFENYKVPDGKPKNKFNHNGNYQSYEMAIEVIEECHRHWYELILRASPTEKKYCLDSLTLQHFLAEGLTHHNTPTIKIPLLQYPKYLDINWTESKIFDLHQKKPKF